MSEYTLYLDESKSVDNIFVVGGFAVSIDKENELQIMLKALKDSIWNDTKEKIAPVFHATDYIKRYPKAFKELIDIVKVVNGKVFATVIKLDEISELYGQLYNGKDDSGYIFIDDPFNIALQKIIENYTHFLYYNKSFGKTIYEARNSVEQNWLDSPDFLLKKDYLKIITNCKGISYINDAAVHLCNTHFSVKSKKEDLAGLQIADNIAYIVARVMSKSLKENKNISEIFNEIFELAYNGGFDINKKDMRHFYGIKILPEMFRKIYRR